MITTNQILTTIEEAAQDAIAFLDEVGETIANGGEFVFEADNGLTYDFTRFEDGSDMLIITTDGIAGEAFFNRQARQVFVDHVVDYRMAMLNQGVA